MSRLTKTIFVLGTTVLAVAACSSTTTTTTNPGTGGGSDAGGHDATVTLPDGSTTTVPQACNLWETYQQKCAQDPYAKSDACLQGRLQNCDATLATWSSAYQAAVVACVSSSTDCENGPSQCIDQNMHDANIAIGTVQKSIRDHFCSVCHSLTDCQNAFYLLDPQNGDGPGAIVLQMSDAIAQQVDQSCTQPSQILDASAGDDGGTLDCTTAFSQCAADVASSALPGDPDACYPPSTGDDSSTGDDGASDAPADAPSDSGPG